MISSNAIIDPIAEDPLLPSRFTQTKVIQRDGFKNDVRFAFAYFIVHGCDRQPTCRMTNNGTLLTALKTRFSTSTQLQILVVQYFAINGIFAPSFSQMATLQP